MKAIGRNCPNDGVDERVIVGFVVGKTIGGRVDNVVVVVVVAAPREEFKEAWYLQLMDARCPSGHTFLTSGN